MLRSKADGEHAPSAPSSLIICSLIVLGVAAVLLSTRAVGVATGAAALLPRWDLAAHLVNGWTPYDHLVHGRVAAFVGDLWHQGYWPPAQSLFQVPFYTLFGGALSGGLHSSIAAFLLSGLCVVLLLGHIVGRRAWLPGAIAFGFMLTSPFYLAYGSVAMSEMLGAMAQLLVLVAWSHHERRRTVAATRWLALSLTWLFFVKYNYFVLLAVPLTLHAFLAATVGLSPQERVTTLWRHITNLLATTPGRIAAAYVAVVAAVVAAGGFSIDVAGQRVAFRTVGYALHPLLYAGLVHAWMSHRRGHWSWMRLRDHDARWSTWLVWFVMPVVLWLASPHPNHIKDLVYLVVNIPMGQPSTRLGLVAYLDAIRVAYFAHPVVCAIAVAGFVAALVRYREQSPLVRLLLLTALLQITMVTVHHTRDTRFMLLAMPTFWLVSANEIGAWLSRRLPAVATALGVVGLAVATVAVEVVTASESFQRAAFGNYVRSPSLAQALAAIRGAIEHDDRIAVIGRADAISPALVQWQLGPPSGLARPPDAVARVADLPLLETADWILQVEPSEVPMAPATEWLEARMRSGALVSSCVFPMADLALTLSVFRPRADTAPRAADARCRLTIRAVVRGGNASRVAMPILARSAIEP